jgi:simple sugar transport system ATP-binding protein
MSRYFGFDVDPHRIVRDLPIGMQQRVEILKALYREASILILDEPTSVLAPGEIEAFLDGVRVLRDKGCTVIFITYKLEEVIAVADRVSILRHGKVVAERDCAGASAGELARLMVGRDVLLNLRRANRTPGEVILEVKDLSASASSGAPALTDLSFELRAGEILGVAGVDGNGQVELAEAICGLRPLSKGRITMAGRDISRFDIEQRRRVAGLGLVPEDRHRTGLVLDYSVPLNLALRRFNHPPFSRNGILDMGFVLGHAKRLVDDYDIRLRNLSQPVRHLSGGNQQKKSFLPGKSRPTRSFSSSCNPAKGWTLAR